MVCTQEFSGRKSLNYFYLHSAVRKHYILKGQAMLGIVYFVRPKAHGWLKLWPCSGHVLACIWDLLTSWLRWAPRAGESSVSCQCSLSRGCCQITPSPRGEASGWPSIREWDLAALGKSLQRFYSITGKRVEHSELNSLLPLIKTHYHSLRLQKLFWSPLAKTSN